MTTAQNGTKQGVGFAGTLKNIQLADLIQICCLSAVSLGIQVTQDDQQGMIYIDAGAIVHAETQSLKGEDAFYAIMGWQSGSFETVAEDTTIDRTIEQGYQYLLMEAAHQADERDSQSGEEIAARLIQDESHDQLRVLVVEDSSIMCKILVSMLNADENIEVVGTAKNGEEALAQLESLKPDIISLDINMPVMNGSTALKHIMIKNPCPVVIMSNLGNAAHQTIIHFLNLGAVDFMSKPTKSGNILVQQQKIVERIHRSAAARIERFRRMRTPSLLGERSALVNHGPACDRLHLVNVGPGGFGDLTACLAQLKADCTAAVVVLQSLPPALTDTLAAYFNARCPLPVLPLETQTPLMSGHCYLSTNGRAMSFTEADHQPVLVQETDEVNGGLMDTNPIDKILSSAAAAFGERLSVAFLSGAEIGTLDGVRTVRDNGGQIVVADPQLAVVADTLETLRDSALAHNVASPTDISNHLLQ
ncbi:MAG: chemotaxis protein CheB [Desulfosarcinaceae bacterium]|nr:chemotaxis protein CheB [Desulfosarcinaceae bacterium]